MRLTVLGNNGPYPAAAGACSGYLISYEDTNLLIDCGNGVLSNLQRFIPIEKLDAIILTHLHSDHTSDMMVLRYATQMKIKKGLQEKIPVYAPSEPAEEFEKLNLPDVFVLESIDSNTSIKIGKLNIAFSQMQHPVKCVAVSIFDGHKRLVYSGDTSWTEELVDFSYNADFLLLDSGLLNGDKENNPNVYHMTAGECGKVAKLSNSKRLVLTHFFPEHDIKMLLSQAREEFPAAEASSVLAQYEIK